MILRPSTYSVLLHCRRIYLWESKLIDECYILAKKYIWTKDGMWNIDNLKGMMLLSTWGAGGRNEILVDDFGLDYLEPSPYSSAVEARMKPSKTLLKKDTFIVQNEDGGLESKPVYVIESPIKESL